MPAFNENIVELVKENRFFRQEIATNPHSQLVLMSVEPGDDIGDETHDVDQVLFFVSGSGEAVLDQKRSPIAANSLVLVPAGTRHNFINTGDTPLKLFSVYAPAEHAPGTIHKSKADAVAAEKEHHALNR